MCTSTQSPPFYTGNQYTVTTSPEKLSLLFAFSFHATLRKFLQLQLGIFPFAIQNFFQRGRYRYLVTF